MDMMDFFFFSFFRAMWAGVVIIVWFFKAIAWVFSAVLNRREINRPE